MNSVIQEASILLSKTQLCFRELWQRTVKVAICLQLVRLDLMKYFFIQINELERTLPFSEDSQLLTLVRSCLQVDSSQRPSAVDAQKYLK